MELCMKPYFKMESFHALTSAFFSNYYYLCQLKNAAKFDYS